MAISPTTPTVAGPPDTSAVAQQILALMAALSGVLTDYNIGSTIRTQSESLGAVVETQGISALTLALQTIVYSAMSLFGITPNVAVPAVGTVVFLTSLANPPPATQNVSIPQGTLVQTIGGIKFATTTTVTLLAGSASINVPIQAVVGGLITNVPPGAIVQIITGLSYPLVVTNFVPTIGGLDAETFSQALTRLNAEISSLVGGSPVSVANATVGVTASGTSETVVYATCYEPWLAAPVGSPAASQVGFNVYIDNGTGTASPGLISAVQAKLGGNFGQNIPGYRPSGVPYNVYADIPVSADVTVTGVVSPNTSIASITSNIVAAVSGYFSLPFGVPAQQGAISAAVANASLGLLRSFGVVLAYHNTSTSVPTVSGSLIQRVILNNLIINLTQ